MAKIMGITRPIQKYPALTGLEYLATGAGEGANNVASSGLLRSGASKGNAISDNVGA